MGPNLGGVAPLTHVFDHVCEAVGELQSTRIVTLYDEPIGSTPDGFECP